MLACHPQPGFFINKVLIHSFFVLALSLALATVYGVCLGYHSGPFRDMWIAMDFIRGWFSGEASWIDLFSLHGGAHRLAVPKLLFLFDYGIFSGSNLFLILIAFLTQLSMVYLMWLWVRDDPALTSGSRGLLIALTLLLMFNATQLENFLYTFDMQWFITVAAAAWALRCWVRFFSPEVSSASSGIRVALAGGACGLISLFSSFSGACLWLLLPLLLITFRSRGRHIGWVLGFVVLILVSYTRGPFGGTTEWIGISGEVTLAKLVHFVIAISWLWMKWIFLYLGSPLGREYFSLAAIFVGGSLIFLGFQSVRLLRSGSAGFSSFQIWCLFIALFAVAVGLVTGWGRMHMVNTADEDRYQSVVALYWLGVFTLAYLRMVQFRWLVLAVIFFWTCGVIPYFALKDARAQIYFFDRVKTTNLAIATGQWEHQAIKSTLILGDQWKRINRPEMHGDFLRERRWAVFASQEAQQLGQTFSPSSDVLSACEGQVLSVTPVGAPYQGYRLSGQAYDTQEERLLKKFLIVNEANQIVGLARLQRQRDSLMPITWQPRDSARWVGYTVDLPESTALQIWGERQDASYCLVAKTATIPAP